jgi:uncharacterized protein YcbK (DUF882 family)
MIRDIKYFTDVEFECPCCHRYLISQQLVSNLDSIRKHLDEPIIITSGYRCIKHNMDVGGSPTSSHRIGLAVDIACTSSSYRYRLIKALLAVGINRMKIGGRFIHVDIDTGKKQNVIWIN